MCDVVHDFYYTLCLWTHAMVSGRHVSTASSTLGVASHHGGRVLSTMVFRTLDYSRVPSGWRAWPGVTQLGLKWARLEGSRGGTAMPAHVFE